MKCPSLLLACFYTISGGCCLVNQPGPLELEECITEHYLLACLCAAVCVLVCVCVRVCVGFLYRDRGVGSVGT